MQPHEQLPDTPAVNQGTTPPLNQGTPTADYGTPTADYGTPTANHGIPAADYDTPTADYGATPVNLITQVAVGMDVLDPAGREAGRVAAVQQPGTDVRPDTVAGVAEILMGTGYARIDGTGFLANDTYASGDQIAGVVQGEPGTVTLRVDRDELHRATA